MPENRSRRRQTKLMNAVAFAPLLFAKRNPSFITRLMVEEEFFGIDQRPDEILKILTGDNGWIDRLTFRINSGFAEVINRRFQLGGARLSRERCQIEFSNSNFQWSGIFRQPLCPSAPLASFPLMSGALIKCRLCARLED